MQRLLRVLWLPADEGGCGYHRVRMWNKAFNDLGLAESAVLDTRMEGEEVKMAIEYADVIVGRLTSVAYIKEIKKNWPSKPVILDWDDNTLEVKFSNTAYKEFGTRDVWVEVEDIKKTEYYQKASVGIVKKMEEANALPLWVTGITEGFNRFENLSLHTDLLWGLMACNMATSPVPQLSALWGKFADRSAVVPNALDLDYYPDVEVKRPREKGEIRMGWSGGSSHSGDWKNAVGAIEKMAKKYPGLKLILAGSSFEENFAKYDFVEYHPWVAWEAHPYRMKMLDLDFALIPLADDTSFNDYKSELKMMEFAALKVPMIVKDQLPYSPYIKRGHNSLAYKTPEELEKCIEIMIKGKDNEKLVKNAYDWVTKQRNIKKLAPEVVKLYKSVLSDRQQEKIK